MAEDTEPVTDSDPPLSKTDRLTANLAALRKQGAPDTVLDHYLEQERIPVEHRGRILSATQANAQAAQPQEASTPEKVADALTSFGPLSRSVAGYRGLLSLMGVGSETPEEAYTSQQKNANDLPAAARIPLAMAGSAPLAAAAAPLGAVGGAAALGTAEGASKPANGALDRLTNAVEGGAVAAGTAGVAGLVGKGVANLSNRSGLTDLIGKIAAKLPGQGADDAAAAIGTRGQVNDALSDRQDILDHLGDDGVSAASKQLQRIADTKAQAAELYGKAQQNVAAVNDPRLQALLQDPDVRKVYDTVRQMRSAQGQPLPQAVDVATAPKGATNIGISPEAWARMVARPDNAAQYAGVNPQLGTVPTVDVPDPQALATMKRYLGDAARGLNSPLNLKQDEARDVLGKVGQIRTVLHEVSPEYKAADAFYADAKGQEEAFAHGYDAFAAAKGVTGETLPTQSAEAMHQAITTPRYAGEPADAMANRADAFRAGVRSQMVDQVRSAPADRGLTSVLAKPAFSPDEVTQGVRGLVSDDVPARSAIEQLLAGQRGAAAEAPPTSSHYTPTSMYGAARSLVQKVTRAPDLLETPSGQQAIAARMGSPDLRNAEIAAQRRGESVLDYLARVTKIGAGAETAHEAIP